jgi:hypothetical protein
MMTEAPRKSIALRTIGAALTGIAVAVIPAIATDALMRRIGVFPASGQPLSNPLFLLAAGYRTVYSIAGSYLAARLAPSRPMRLAMILGWIGLAANLGGVAAAWNHASTLGPEWYPISLTVLALPCAWLGGRLARRRLLSGPCDRD